jgi:hypothetical protein
MNIGKWIKKTIKATLPFSGDKTKIALWVLGLVGLQEVSGVPVEEIMAGLASPGGAASGGLVLLLVGLVDKYLKKKYPAPRF